MTRLIEDWAGEDINAKDRHGQTALMVAARNMMVASRPFAHSSDMAPNSTIRRNITSLRLCWQ